MTKDQIKHMVDRFLGWKLPEHFRPDCGIHFDAMAAKKMDPRNHKYEPVGTNLFSADQAETMVCYMIDGMPSVAPTRDEQITRILDQLKGVVGTFLQGDGVVLSEYVEGLERQLAEFEADADLDQKLINSLTPKAPNRIA
jgi:hypothetical protein